MPVATLTSKGQITLPRAVRTALGLDVGDKVGFVESADGFRLVALHRDVRTLRGRFAGRVERPVSIRRMNEVIAGEATRRL
ncbi:MAG: AbrB/MazE/SpoVT family DNA-binding domain-containing protein [Gammaproteobacteria bacterium]|nr:AbrB/MazE/SpoVT family DNA-binding domain-containing protein [Gammaproteobacteria bacterium]